LMNQNRRDLLKHGAIAAGAVAVGAVGASRATAAEPEADKPQEAAAEQKLMVAACGLSCSTCPLMAEKKCKGCATGKKATPEMLEMKKCPVLSCASMKKIDYCGTGCKSFTKCQKLVGRPYAKSFLEMIEKRQTS